MNKNNVHRLENIRKSLSDRLSLDHKVLSVELNISKFTIGDSYSGRFSFDNGCFIEFGSFNTKIERKKVFNNERYWFINFKNCLKSEVYRTDYVLNHLKQSYGGFISTKEDNF